MYGLGLFAPVVLRLLVGRMDTGRCGLNLMVVALEFWGIGVCSSIGIDSAAGSSVMTVVRFFVYVRRGFLRMPAGRVLGWVSKFGKGGGGGGFKLRHRFTVSVCW